MQLSDIFCSDTPTLCEDEMASMALWSTITTQPFSIFPLLAMATRNRPLLIRPPASPSKTMSAASTLRMAGIRISFLQVTGDFGLTALAIADQCGIVTAEGRVHDADSLSRYN
jgi:hypothetical protein